MCACVSTDAVAPGSFPNHAALDSSKAIDNCGQGIDTANDVLGIPKLLTPEALSNPRIDEQSVITYISYFRNADLEGKNRADELSRQAAKCRAYGPGLVEAVAGEPADFVVDTPTQDGKLEIKVEGPAGASNVPVQVNKKQGPGGAATYDVSYNPTTPGLYKVHVTYNGIHIPGSIFTVRILEAISYASPAYLVFVALLCVTVAVPCFCSALTTFVAGLVVRARSACSTRPPRPPRRAGGTSSTSSASSRPRRST